MVESDIVQSVVRACSLVGAFTSEEPELSLKELAARTGLNPSTARRLLVSLESTGFIAQDAKSHRYRLGLRVLEAAKVMQGHWQVINMSRAYMTYLAEVTGESTYLSHYHKGEVGYLEVVESHQSIRLTARIGQHLPAHGVASGKALLAFQPEMERLRVYNKGLQRFTQYTITTPEALERELSTIRERGWSVTYGEQEEDSASVAAPIFGPGNLPLASIAASGPVFRMREERLDWYGRQVAGVAKEISLTLGAHEEQFPPGWLEVPPFTRAERAVEG